METLTCQICDSEDVGDYSGDVLCHKCAEENGCVALSEPVE